MFLGISFLHILPEAEFIYASISEDKKIGSFGPISSVAVILVFLFLLYIEKIKFSDSDLFHLEIDMEDLEHEDHSKEEPEQIGDKGKFSLGGKDKNKVLKKPKVIDLDDYEDQFKKVLDKNKYSHQTIGKFDILLKEEFLQETAQTPKGEDNGPSEVANGVDPASANIGLVSPHANKLRNLAMCIILLVTLSIHGFLEGMALGYTQKRKLVWDLFIGIFWVYFC